VSRVLIVDDEESVRTVVSAFLQRRGYEVVAVGSGPMALARLIGFHPDMILLDIRMPGMDGIETLRKIRELVPSTPVIMVTATDEEEVAHEALRIGACDYITKPFSFEQLDTHLAVHMLMDRV